MEKLINPVIVITGLIISATILFGGANNAPNLAIWFHFLTSAFVVFLWIAVGVIKSL